MGGAFGIDVGDIARQSAPFAVTAEDYRRAFALAIAPLPDVMPPFGAQVKARLMASAPMGLALLAAMVAALIAGRAFQDPGALAEALAEAADFGWKAALTILAILLAIAVLQAWDARGARRRFPRERAAWKRPRRMRVGWDAAGITLAGEEGFGNVAWRTLHAWLDSEGELILFTAPLDPVPIPHAALSGEDLDDLRTRLAAAEVPRVWLPLSDDAQRLKRVFG